MSEFSNAVFDLGLEDGKAYFGRKIFDGCARAASVVGSIAGSEVESTLKIGGGNERLCKRGFLVMVGFEYVLNMIF
jgi:hypothetical protein